MKVKKKVEQEEEGEVDGKISLRKTQDFCFI